MEMVVAADDLYRKFNIDLWYPPTTCQATRRVCPQHRLVAATTNRACLLRRHLGNLPETNSHRHYTSQPSTLLTTTCLTDSTANCFIGMSQTCSWKTMRTKKPPQRPSLFRRRKKRRKRLIESLFRDKQSCLLDHPDVSHPRRSITESIEHRAKRWHAGS